MTSSTNHYKLMRLNKGDSLSENSYQFTDTDKEYMDYLMYMGAEGHHHTGAAAVDPSPTDPLSVRLTTTADSVVGHLPAGTTIRYTYTLVDDNGAESSESPETTIVTPSPIPTPGIPTLSSGTGGSLIRGSYYYTLSAYVGASNNETASGIRAFITLNRAGGTVTVTFPTLPSGADGWNIYKRQPGGVQYLFLATVDNTHSSYTDHGTVSTDCNRPNPVSNTTNVDSGVVISMPGATPSVPVGYSWKLYRTFTLGDWSNSLLNWVTEETYEGSGITTPTFMDLGGGTQPGTFPTQSEIVGSPGKIDLGTEVSGSLAPASLQYSHIVEYSVPGTLSVETGTFAWRCPFEYARIRDVGLSLGVASSPSSTDVQVDVKRASVGTSVFTSIFAGATPGTFPSVPVGHNIGPRLSPSIGYLELDDQISIDIVQTGGGATPTDHDLLVQVRLWVYDPSVTVLPFS